MVEKTYHIALYLGTFGAYLMPQCLEMCKKWELLFNHFSAVFELQAVFWVVFKYRIEKHKKVAPGIDLNVCN